MNEEFRELGPYQLVRRLGAGATGTVWQAQSTTGAQVAVKILHPHLVQDEDAVSRFMQERAILKGLPAHPNLVSVQDMIVQGDTLAIVTDLVQGPDLRQAITERGGTLPAAEAVRLTCGLLRGLALVHASGVVHRDVKPENILLEMRPDAAPVPRLTDFGVSKILTLPASTASSALIGTPEYIAPELARGQAPQPAADLYAIGILLHRMLCGVTPFVGGSVYEVLRRQTDALPGRPDGIHDQLWSVISRLLLKSPAERPTSAAQLSSDLESLLPLLEGTPALPCLTQPPAWGHETPTVHRPVQDRPVEATQGLSRPRRFRSLVWVPLLAAFLVLAGGLLVTTQVLTQGTSSAAQGAGPGDSASSSTSGTTRPTESTVSRTATARPATATVTPETESAIPGTATATLETESAIPGTATAVPGTDISTPPVRHAGELTIYNLYADLDAPASDHQWGTLDRVKTTKSDLTITTSGVSRYAGRGLVLLPTQQGTYDDCHRASYLTQAIPLDQLEDGSMICLRTDQGRTSILRVIGQPKSGKPVTFHITTYDDPRS